MAQNFKDTLNLPDTGFPMRANLSAREPARWAHWESRGLYAWLLERRQSRAPYLLHDGPPYANGDIHMGHALNKVLKDLVLRHQTMLGRPAPYVPGWDCHGLPIEQQVLKSVGDKIHEMEPLALRRLCHDYAHRYIDLQRRQFQRLGILGDWARPYATTDRSYEVGILRCLRDLVAAGLIYKGFRVVHWDPVFRTALAEAEIEYETHISDSIHVRFPLVSPENCPVLAGLDTGGQVSLVIWTTTPWTLPANLAVCLHPTLSYVAWRAGEETYVVAEGLLEAFRNACGLTEGRLLATFGAAQLERSLCRHPLFPDRTSLVVLGEHVTLEQGTGCVHTAPGHGAEDFAVGRRYGLPVVVPVDERGRFTAEYAPLQGVNVFEANPRIVASLRENGRLLAAGQVRHEYPYSWRSKKPIIFRATEQWFMELAEGGVRARALQAIDREVNWVPPWGRERIRGMVERRPEWCLSRQRAWGVPIPSLRSRASGRSFLDLGVLDRFLEVVREEGSDCWFRDPVERFLPEGFVYAPTGESRPEDFSKDQDIVDVWFESGASHRAVLEQDPRLGWPADLYLEGSDQHRGWFQSSLLTSVGTRGQAPFRTVLTHGFVLDDKGRAMSKSMGNVLSPLDLIDEFGADVVRLWVCSLDYRNDVAVSRPILAQVAETYRTIRNTLRFQLGNLRDYGPARDAVVPDRLLPLDRWVLHQLHALVQETSAAYTSWEFHKVYQAVNRFCTVTLSATYHTLVKDRLYTLAAASPERRSAQTAIAATADTLCRLLAPVLVFTADEAWGYARGAGDLAEESVHDQPFPEPDPAWHQPALAADLDRLLGELAPAVNERLERLRQEKRIGRSLDAALSLVLAPDDARAELLRTYQDQLPELFGVSRVEVDLTPVADLTIQAQPAGGENCPRCWRWVPSLVSCGETAVCPRCATALQFQP